MQASLVDSIKSYSELDDSGILTQEALNCTWGQQHVSGRPDSPLQFDHDELVGINTDQDVCCAVVSCLLVWCVLYPVEIEIERRWFDMPAACSV